MRLGFLPPALPELRRFRVCLPGRIPCRACRGATVAVRARTAGRTGSRWADPGRCRGHRDRSGERSARNRGFRPARHGRLAGAAADRAGQRGRAVRRAAACDAAAGTAPAARPPPAGYGAPGGRRGPGGDRDLPGQGRVACPRRLAEAEWDANAREIAAHVASAAADVQAERVVVAGDPRARSALLDHLKPALREMTETVAAEVPADSAAMAEAAEKTTDNYAERAVVSRFATWQSRIGDGITARLPATSPRTRSTSRR